MEKKYPDSSLLFLVLGGMFSLVIAMGVGRFAFTPLIPIMQREFLFGVQGA